MVLAEKAMEGVYKSVYVNLSTSYHISMDDRGNGISLGLGFVNNNTRIDMARLSFDQQLSSSGFDRALPSMETANKGSTSYSSANAGILYTYDSDNSFINLGVSGYRFFKTKRSLFDDPTQTVDPRYSIHADLGTALSETLNANLSCLHSIQNKESTTTFGAMLGIQRSTPNYDYEHTNTLNLGLFYKLNQAIVPCIGYIINRFQFGLSYDINMIASASASSHYNSVELSLIYRKKTAGYNAKMVRYHSPF